MEIEDLETSDSATFSVCPFPKGRKAGIRCRKIIMAEMKSGGWKRICPEPSGECVYHE